MTWLSLRHLTNYLNQVRTFMPSNLFILVFDMLKILVMLYLFFELPYVISFEVQEYDFTNWSVMIVMIADISVKLNVSYIERGKESIR